MAKKVKYIGEDVLTRGNYGESVQFGREQDGVVMVWDSDRGFFVFGPMNDEDWAETGEIVEDVEADW